MAEVVNNLFKVVFGVLLIIIAVWFAWPGSIGASWGKATLELIKGGIVLFVILIGLVLLLVGLSDLKNAE